MLKKNLKAPLILRSIPWALMPNTISFLFDLTFGGDIVVCRVSQIVNLFLWIMVLRQLKIHSQIRRRHVLGLQVLSLVIALFVNGILVSMPLEIIHAGRSILWDFPFGDLAPIVGSTFVLNFFWCVTLLFDLFFTGTR